jgi:hypothetical protein
MGATHENDGHDEENKEMVDVLMLMLLCQVIYFDSLLDRGMAAYSYPPVYPPV